MLAMRQAIASLFSHSGVPHVSPRLSSVGIRLQVIAFIIINFINSYYYEQN